MSPRTGVQRTTQPRRRPGRPVDGDSDRTRTQLLEAAIACFAVRGLSRTTLRDVSDAAGLTTGTLYHHYAAKEALYLAAYEKAVEDMYGEYSAVLDEHPDLQTRLARIFELATHRVSAGSQPMTFVLRAWVEHENDHVPLPQSDSVVAFMARLVDDAVAEGVLRRADGPLLQDTFRTALWGLSCIGLTGSDKARSAADGVVRLFAGSLVTAPASRRRRSAS